uniref:Secreted protein n=1 Tax=Ixodes ricinus TaxID=34613 RepID=A0A6B0U0F5_IXORI
MACRLLSSCRMMISLVSLLSSRIFSRMDLGTSGMTQRIRVIRVAIRFSKMTTNANFQTRISQYWAVRLYWFSTQGGVRWSEYLQ